MRLIFLLLLSTFSFAQKGGINYPVLTKADAIKQGYVLVWCADSLIKYSAIAASKIFIASSFTITQRCTVATGVTIQSSKQTTILSTAWFNTFRIFETFFISGKNVRLQGLKLKGSNADVLSLDYPYMQSGIRVAGDSCTIINCEVTDFDWCGIYAYRFSGLVIDQCYIARCKRYGYGYGVWFEGKPNHIGLVKNCIFEENRESIDAGGQLTIWTADGNVSDGAIVCHLSTNDRAGIGTTAINNYMVSGVGIGFPYPGVDSGWVTITGNYSYLDSVNAFYVRGNPNSAAINISGNHYLGEGMNQPSCEIRVDSIYPAMVKFSFLSVYQKCEVIFGDGSRQVFINGGVLYHSYIPGTYNISMRTFDSRCIPSKWTYKKIVVGTGLNFALKTSARFNKAGFYQIQILVDDTVIDSMDITSIWSWTRFNKNYCLSGLHKIAIRIICIQSCMDNIQLWIDDFDYSGKILNSTFDDDRDVYHPPFSYWKFKTSPGVGAGVTGNERCNGQSWHFEFRPSSPISVDSYAEIYQVAGF